MIHINVFVRILIVLVLLISLTVQDASALIVKKELKELTDESDSIITGKVINKQSYWDRGMIFTDIVISPDIRIKGKNDTQVVMKIPGGTVGNKYLDVSDVPFFEKGEDVLLFSNGSNITGMSQGKYSIKKDRLKDNEESLAEFIHKIKKEGKIKKEKGKHGKDIDVISQQLDTVSPVLPRVDKSRNNTTSPPYLNNSWSLIKYEGFEGAFADAWGVYGSPAWCDTNHTSAAGSWSIWPACAGSGSVGADRTQPDNLNSWLVYGPFSLEDATDARVRFKHLTNSESFSDRFEYLASIDGKTFYGNQLSGDWKAWREEILDLKKVYTLGDLRGQPKVWIAFHFASDGSTGYSGTFLDEIYVEKSISLSVAPHILSVSPSYGPSKAAELGSGVAAEDSTQVTIAGTNFGTIAGSVKFWRAGSENFDAAIQSWTDTQIVAKVPGRISSYYKPDNTGNVQVVKNDGTVSDNYGEFRVTYSYGGGNWLTPPTYKVNPNTADTSGELEAVQAAANTWNNAGANFGFTYGGLSAKTIAAQDGENSILWRANVGPGILAAAYTWGSLDPHVIVENDIEFNDDYAWSTDGLGSAFDIQSIGTHELGHWLKLLDMYGTEDSPKMMFGFGSSGGTKRTLNIDDISGIISIYGQAAVNPATVFVRSLDNAIWQNKWSGSSWSGWTSLGGNATSNISTAVLGSETYIFVNGSDNAVWFNKRSGTSWSGWTSMGGKATSDPDAVAFGSDLYVFVRGTDNALWYKKLSGITWSSWTSMGGYATSNSDSMVVGSDLYAFVRGTDNALYYSKFSGTSFTPWASMGGYITSDPETDSNSVIVRGADNALWINRLSGSAWSGWTSMGGKATSNSDALLNEIFVRGTDNAIWQNKWSGSSWNGWASLGGYATSDPDAIVSGTEKFLFVRGLDNALWYNKLGGAGWTSMGGYITSNPSAVPN